MRIVSLLPSATEIVFALGLGDELVGRSHECDYPPEALEVPAVTRAAGDLPDPSSREVHQRVQERLHGGSSLYELDEAALAEAHPDLILTQELCEVCAVSYRQVTAAVRRLDAEATVLSLEPSSIEGILNTITTVGAMTEAEDEAVGLVELLRERLGHLENRVLERRLEGVRPRRVACLEWLDPPFASGHWVPEQVRRAGGWDLLGREGERSYETTWQALAEVDPEQLFLMPCGFDAPGTREAWARAELPPAVSALRAVREGQVLALDGSAYFSRPGPRVVDGISLLAELIDPDGFAGQAPAGSWLPI
ncbi:MAG TPA: cobalamin-binding protein [Candidatus Limnocylindrales bacterium]|nr:cobalamin-binding protein [Candidatus Limnocylindrales bacterium]